jgi:hypothetical protein
MSNMIHGLHTPSDGGTSARKADPTPPVHVLPTGTVGTCNTPSVPRTGGVSHAPTWDRVCTG